MMNDDCTLLNAIRQTTEMGADGIDAVLPYTSGEFRQALKQQLTEYQKSLDSADTLLHKLGGEPEDVSTFTKWSSELTSGLKTMMDSSQSNIANMMIQGNTMGVTKSMQTMRRCDVQDAAVSRLADKLLATERTNITQMKSFL